MANNGDSNVKSLCIIWCVPIPSNGYQIYTVKLLSLYICMAYAYEWVERSLLLIIYPWIHNKMSQEFDEPIINMNDLAKTIQYRTRFQEDATIDPRYQQRVNFQYGSAKYIFNVLHIRCCEFLGYSLILLTNFSFWIQYIILLHIFSLFFYCKWNRM